MRGIKITAAQVEQIKATFAETGSITLAAKSAQVGLATAKKYIDLADGFEELRNEKQVDIITQMYAARAAYLEHLAKPEIMASASASDAARIVGILTDKLLLLTGQPTERIEHVSLDEARGWVLGRIEQIVARRAGPTDSLDAGGGGADHPLGLGGLGTGKPVTAAG